MTKEEFVAICKAMGDLRPDSKIESDFRGMGDSMLSYFEERGYLIDEPVYCTSFCNRGHSLEDGKPIDHECYVLTIEGMMAEERGDYSFQPFRTSRIHPGKKARLGPRPKARER